MLSCESIGSQPTTCQADTRGGVRLARQLSRSACIEGQSWGATGDGIWVKDGCRAQFAIGYGGRAAGSGYGTRVVRCDSSGNRWNHCAVDTSRGIELVRQLSDRACIRDRSWGVDERGIWVSGGCRAEFRMRTGRADRDDDKPRAQIVRCESRVGRPTRCPVDTEGGVRLVRQLSKAACAKDQTWNFDSDGIWVERGCRADFEVSVREKRGRGWRFWRRR
ncbi:DUF3011 domain-containing protein [Lysobacter koreensis]|uniref:DUF3011 domain-containing protein n=1 Tax=Lysobacter koreensis TaxID=266122 RepID=A0ABW2YI16_9GAMM